MRLPSLIEEAWLAVRTNRSRTVLTILGIVIGVGAVISVVGIGDGAKQVVGDLLGQYGSTSLIVFPNVSAIRASKGAYKFEEMTRDDVNEIDAGAPSVAGVTPQITMDVKVRPGGAAAGASGSEVQATLVGTMHQYLSASKLTLDRGRFLNTDDDQNMRKVAVLGADLAKKLYGDADPVGEVVRINGTVEATVIGVLAPEEKSFISTVSDFDTSNNNRLFVPSSAIERVGGSSQIYMLNGEAVSKDKVEDAKREIVAILDQNHGKWDGKVEKYQVQEMGQILSMIDTATGTLTAAVSLIAGIALLSPVSES